MGAAITAPRYYLMACCLNAGCYRNHELRKNFAIGLFFVAAFEVFCRPHTCPDSLLEVAPAMLMQQRQVPSAAIREWSTNRLRMDRVVCGSSAFESVWVDELVLTLPALKVVIERCKRKSSRLFFCSVDTSSLLDNATNAACVLRIS